MEIIRYKVVYVDDEYNDVTEEGWAFGEDVSDAITQITGYYDEDSIESINIQRIEERDHGVLPDWEADEATKN